MDQRDVRGVYAVMGHMMHVRSKGECVCGYGAQKGCVRDTRKLVCGYRAYRGDGQGEWKRLQGSGYVVTGHRDSSTRQRGVQGSG